MTPMVRRRPFSDAFREWFTNAVDLHDIMSLRPASDHDAVEIVFSIGAGALQGYGHRNGISVAALRDQQVWDYLYDLDIVAEFSQDGWSCSLCIEDREYFHSVEGLWATHSFEALRKWVDEILRPAEMLEFCGGDGVTWARLTDVVQHPTEDVFAIRL